MASRASQYRSAAQAACERRDDPRARVTVRRASVRRQGAEGVDAELLDLSIYGCRIGCADPYEPGERVWLRLAGGMPIAANVVWCRDGLVGCRFDDPIDRATMRAMTLHLVS